MISVLGKQPRPVTPEPTAKTRRKYEHTIALWPDGYWDWEDSEAYFRYLEWSDGAGGIPLRLVERIQRWWRRISNRLRIGYYVD